MTNSLRKSANTTGSITSKIDRSFPITNTTILFKKLEKMEADHPEWVTPTSPTQRVKDPLSKGFKQAAHAVPMLSLDNTYNTGRTRRFHQAGPQTVRKNRMSLFVPNSKWMVLPSPSVMKKGSILARSPAAMGKKGMTSPPTCAQSTPSL